MTPDEVVAYARAELERSRAAGEDFDAFKEAFPKRLAWSLRVARVVERVPTWVKHVPVVIADLGAKHGEYDARSDVIRLNVGLFTSTGRVGQVDELTFVTLHEFGHAMASRHGSNDDSSWHALSSWERAPDDDRPGFARYVETRPGWPAGPSPWRHCELAWFTRPYASKSPSEDLADCAAYAALGWREAFRFGGEEKLMYVEKIFSSPSGVPRAS